MGDMKGTMMAERHSDEGNTTDKETGIRRRKKMRTWIMVGVAIIVIFVFVHLAIEGLIDYRWRANEISACSMLRLHPSAQMLFSMKKFATIPGNTSLGLDESAYADNFRNLYYGKTDKGEHIRLISQHMADAFLVDNALDGAPTPPEAPTVAKPYSGYYFVEDMFGMLPASGYSKKFTLMAFPAEYGISGYKIFWVDDTWKVKSYDPKVAKGTPASELARLFHPPTPLSDNPLVKWEDAR